ncbi:MAG: hypothetical protein ABI270_04000 [Nitrosospira sp.]
MPNGHGRSFFRAQTLETGRHQSYEQAFEGEYAFSIDQGDSGHDITPLKINGRQFSNKSMRHFIAQLRKLSPRYP